MRRTSPEENSETVRLGASKAVFACIWPETRRATQELRASNPDELLEKPYEGRQDGMEEELLDSWLSYSRPVLGSWESAFAHRYATFGSTEALREIIAQVATKRNGKAKIHVLEGEYEGYAATAAAYGLAVERHARDTAAATIKARGWPGDLFFTSQPSAIDGNVWDGLDKTITTCESAGVGVIVDLAYVGSVARAFTVDLSSPAIEAVVFSLSKVFGVFYHRIGGAFSKRELPGLHGNQWFKNPFSLKLGTNLCQTQTVFGLAQKYLETQAAAIARLNDTSGTRFSASDSILIATAEHSDNPALEGLRRGNGKIRACLTPALDSILKEQIP